MQILKLTCLPQCIPRCIPCFMGGKRAGTPAWSRAGRASTYRFCRLGNTGRARTRGPRTRSVDTRTPRTALPRWPRSDTARTATPATQATVRAGSPSSALNVTHSPTPGSQSVRTGLGLSRLPRGEGGAHWWGLGCSIPPSSTPEPLYFYQPT